MLVGHHLIHLKKKGKFRSAYGKKWSKFNFPSQNRSEDMCSIGYMILDRRERKEKQASE